MFFILNIGTLKKIFKGRPLSNRTSILSSKSPDRAIMPTPLIDLLYGIGETSTRDLIVAGVVSLVMLVVFLRMKLG
jgi:hypothetical protein